jgi:hypothetical protein
VSTAYRNPVHSTYFADPFVMRAPESGSRYVAIGTGVVDPDGKVFEVLVSDDLVSWQSLGGALEPPAGLGGDCWAPEVAAHDGRWWMYYSCGQGDVGHSLRVAVADCPVGPYVDLGLDLTPDERFAIDPHPFQDVDGQWYLFYARDVLEGDRVGTMLAVDRLDDMTRLRGEPRTILTPTSDWQIYLREREMYGKTTTGTPWRDRSSGGTTTATGASTPAAPGWSRRTASGSWWPTTRSARGRSPEAATASRSSRRCRDTSSGRATTAWWRIPAART